MVSRVRSALLLLLVLIAGPARSGEKTYKLSQLLDPLEEDFPLQAYDWEQWKTLDADTRRRAQGTDPAEWTVPPPLEETEEEKRKREEKEQEREERIRRQKAAGTYRDPANAPGFRFDDRLEEKRKAFEALIQPASASKLEGLIKQLDKLDKAFGKLDREIETAQEDFDQIAKQVGKAQQVFIDNYKKKHDGAYPDEILISRPLVIEIEKQSARLQRLLALRQSELQFHEWLLDRVVALVAELTDEERAKPVAALAVGLTDKDWRERARAAAMLGRLSDPRSTAAFSAAMEKEKDPLVLADLIRIRVKRGGEGVFELLAQRIDDEQWPVRAAVIRELSRMRRKESVDLLVARMQKEDGRLLDDIAGALRGLTGKNFLPEPDPWRIWWEKNRESWTPPKEGEVEASDGKRGGGVYFYGIRSSSKRVVFCIDISGSMDFPLDGRNGKEPPRIESAKKELNQALAALPEDAQFNLVVYSADVSVWKKKMQPATLRNKQVARKYVDRLKPDGATNIYDALITSMEIAARVESSRKAEVPEADTIYFLTDGIPSNGKIVEPSQILEEISSRNALLGLVIHTVGVSKDQDRAFLLNLAKRNGGEFVAVGLK